jgi:NADH-quinone oxidoreductase subunit J
VAEIIFFLIALSTCVCALLTVTSRHVFHSAVWLSLCLLSVASLYFYLQAEFLGVIQILVYIGGIITLFIFAIKLTAHIDDQSIRQVNRQKIPSALAAATLFGILIYVTKSFSRPLSETPVSFTLQELGHSLMTKYVLPFEFISVLLLAVMVGAIVIGRVKK